MIFLHIEQYFPILFVLSKSVPFLSDMTEKYAVVEDIRNSVDEIQKKMEQISIEQKE